MHSEGDQTHIFTILREGWRLFGSLLTLLVAGAIIGLLAGAATSWLLVEINHGLHSNGRIPWVFVITYCTLCGISCIGSALAGAINSIVGQRLIASLRKDLSKRISGSPISIIETVGSHRIFATLTSDIDSISAFILNFSSYTVASAITLGSFAYLLYLSKTVFVISTAGVGVGILANVASHRAWIRDFELARKSNDQLFKQYHAIIAGFKELKMNKERRHSVINHKLTTAADDISYFKANAMHLYWAIDALSSTIYFVIIGILILFRDYIHISSAELGLAIIILLYAKSPVDQVASAVPVFEQAKISFVRIAHLTSELDYQEYQLGFSVDLSQPQSPEFNSLELDGVTYSHEYDGSPGHFVLGPVSVKIVRGEIVFVVGDNGSGKTTLLKLLLGLYKPKTGELRLNGVRVTPASLDDYRQHFSVIFSDYYLFDAALKSDIPIEDYLGLLRKMEISDRTVNTNGEIMIDTLSTGQRKRLALVHSYLEKRPIFVTDEWAADQDPSFRRVFYEEILPGLRKQGKTIIAITHDDSFFDAADRIIRLKDGKTSSE